MTSGVAVWFFFFFVVGRLTSAGLRSLCRPGFFLVWRADVQSPRRWRERHRTDRSDVSGVSMKEHFPYSRVPPWLTCAGFDGQLCCSAPESHHRWRADTASFHCTQNADRAQEEIWNFMIIVCSDSFYNNKAGVRRVKVTFPDCPADKQMQIFGGERAALGRASVRAK